VTAEASVRLVDRSHYFWPRQLLGQCKELITVPVCCSLYSSIVKCLEHRVRVEPEQPVTHRNLFSSRADGIGLPIADFIRDREPSLVRLKFLACLRNLNLPDTTHYTFLAESPMGKANLG